MLGRKTRSEKKRERKNAARRQADQTKEETRLGKGLPKMEGAETLLSDAMRTEGGNLKGGQVGGWANEQVA